jgi:hypothetical protein
VLFFSYLCGEFSASGRKSGKNVLHHSCSDSESKNVNKVNKKI